MNDDMNVKRWDRKRILRSVRYVLPLFLLALAIALPIISSERGERSTETNVDDSAAIEALYGIRFKRVNLLANGGAVEFRFLVTDPDKANTYMHDPEYMPVLIAEDSGARVEPPDWAHGNLVFRAASGYPHMYSNPGGVIQPGRPITIEFGDLRLEHIMVEK